jgi:predicted MFS family arabinose efflux permease
MSASASTSWRLALGGALAMAVAMGIGRFVYTPILPFMAEGIPLTASQAGLIASANFAGYLVGALIAATSWIGGSRRAWLLGGLAASAATTILSAATDAVPLLSAIRFAGGVASAFVLVFSSSVVLERLALSGRAGLSAIHFGGVGAGIAFSAALVSLLAACGFGWQAQWVIAGAAALAALPVVAWLVPPDGPVTRTQAASGRMAVDLRLGALIAAYGLFGFGYVITATFLVAIVRGSPEIRYLEPVIWMGFGICAAPSALVWSAFARRIGTFKAFALACLVEGFGVAASVLIVSTTGVLLATLCLGGTFIALTALGLVGARRLSVADPRRVLALMTVAFGAGQIVGPVLAGTLVEHSGSYTLPSLIAAGTLVAAALLTAPLDRAARTKS